MSKDDTIQDEEIEEALEHLLNRRDLRYVFCKACGSEMRHSPLIICSDCLDEEADKFYKVAINDDDEE